MELAPQLAKLLEALTRRPADTVVVRLDGAAMTAPKPAGPYLVAPEIPELVTGGQAQALYRRTLEAMRRVLKRAGLPGHHGLHALRHTFGSGLVSRGHSLAFVQQQMGHASIGVTVDVYGSWLPIEQPGAIRGLAEALLGTLAADDGHQVTPPRRLLFLRPVGRAGYQREAMLSTYLKPVPVLNTTTVSSGLT